MPLKTVAVATADHGFVEVVGDMFGEHLAIVPEIGTIDGDPSPAFTGRTVVVHVPSGRYLRLPGAVRELAEGLAALPIDWSTHDIDLTDSEKAAVVALLTELEGSTAAVTVNV